MEQLDFERIAQAAELLRQVAGATDSGPMVGELWSEFAAWAKVNRRSFPTMAGKMKPVLAVLGTRRANTLKPSDIDRYRVKRMTECTRLGEAPKHGTINRETGILRRVLSFAAERGRIPRNPIGSVKLLPENGRRRAKIGDERQLDLFLDGATAMVEAMTLVSIDSGLRRLEVYRLHESQIDWATGTVDLGQVDTKTGEPRRPKLSQRALAAIRALPRPNGWIFGSRKTGKPY